MEAGTQFIGIKPNVDMTERRSNVANNSTQVFTIEDISDAVAPYGVYTALLTQTGSGSRISEITSGELTVGVTYYIFDNGDSEGDIGSGFDFTNVGAPSNDFYTYFVATGTTPNSWGTGMLLYTETTPVVTVLENTIGYIWFEYNDVGSYYMKSNGLFTGVFPVIINNIDLFDVGSSISQTLQVIDPDTILIRTSDVKELSDDFLVDTPIEIRVYG